MAKEKIYVVNARGETEPFSLRKVYRSCRRIGASKKLAEEITKEIENKIYPGIDTSEIFKWVKERLSGTSFKSGMKFSLREAMRKLGPTGFDFEKYIGEVFIKNGFEVGLNQNVPGSCISSYEIDFVAKKGGLIYLGECKYHHQAGKRVDLKVGLSNYAKFLDISRDSAFPGFQIKTLLVTNAKFTSKLKRYSKCVGIELLGWRYPRRKGLERMIEKKNLYPITILPSFKRYLKKIFAQKRIMLALELLEDSPKKIAQKLKLPLKEINKLVEEAKILLEK